MQDRFKFRVWHMPWDETEQPEMLYNAESAYDYMGEVPSSSFGSVLDDESFEVMQCTGLKDKNDKLIYEHDILKTLYTKPNGEVINRNCVVEYNRGAFWINYGIGASYLYNDDCIYEVIGNIYENPELLESN